MANDEIKKRVSDAIEVVRPYLQNDGGDISLVEVTDDLVVKVKLLGACGSCPYSIMTLKDVYKRQVVNRNGLLTGKVHFPGRETMKELLESEGVKVEDDAVVDFEKLFWDPVRELDFDQNPPKPF